MAEITHIDRARMKIIDSLSYPHHVLVPELGPISPKPYAPVVGPLTILFIKGSLFRVVFSI